MQQYASLHLEIAQDPAQANIYLVEVDMDTGDKSILAKIVLPKAAHHCPKFTGCSLNYTEAEKMSQASATSLMHLADYFDHHALSGFTAFRHVDPRTTLLDAGYDWLLKNRAAAFEEPDLRVEDDSYKIFAKAPHNSVPRRPVTNTPRPRRSKQNFKVWI
jgi:hypothetical protein